MVRRSYRRAYPQRRRKIPQKYHSKTKQMVTGSGPTLLEKIASGAGSIAKVAAAVLPAISMINTEQKYSDLAATVQAYNPGTNDSIQALSYSIAQGTTDVSRIGNSVLLKDFYIKGYVQWTASTTIHFGITRLMFFVWKANVQDNPPTVAKLFENPNDLNSPVNKDYSDQFVVIKDKWFSHQAQISAATLQSPKLVKMYKPLNFHARWDAGTTADSTLNHLYFILRGGAATSANQSQFTYYSRVNFTDN